MAVNTSSVMMATHVVSLVAHVVQTRGQILALAAVNMTMLVCIQILKMPMIEKSVFRESAVKAIVVGKDLFV